MARPPLRQGDKLPAWFYQRKTEVVARELLGQRLVHLVRGRRRSGIIVETEAYLGAEDPACHTWRGRRTQRVRSMYLEGGHAYVYLVYGLHHCFNVVSRGAEEPEAVLVRALAPDEGKAGAMNGPGKLCRALGISRRQDGLALTGETIFVEYTGRLARRSEVARMPRIGVDYAGAAAKWPLRFFLRASPHVSRKEKEWKEKARLTKRSGPNS